MATVPTLLDKVKLALRMTTSEFDTELTDLIAAAKADIEIVGVDYVENDALMERAVVTYCKCNFGQPDDYDRLKAAYDEQKAQFRCNSTYMENEDGQE